MIWTLLILAGLFEVCWAVGMKYSDGFSRFWPSVWTIITMALSVILLAAVMRTLPVGTAYTVWTGIGAVGAVIAGFLLFHEPLEPVRLLFLTMIIIGIVGLKLVTRI